MAKESYIQAIAQNGQHMIHTQAYSLAIPPVWIYSSDGRTMTHFHENVLKYFVAGATKFLEPIQKFHFMTLH
jgi:hypothetical protein